jgi:glutamate-ammonia-ligase adenylyltransferase
MAMSFSGLEQYYQLQGRDWERYAMIKARLISGREQDRKYLQSMLTPFVYRRYLDFSMIESIREMKSMINAQMKRKRMTNNIKLGPGGIREIEFIGQTLQLIRAGREPELRERGLIKVLTLLAEKNYLKKEEADSLITAYWFLRKLENRLQMLNDKQTHVLPDDELSRQRICLAMDMQDWDTLIEQLSHHQNAVDFVFQNLIALESEEHEVKASAITLFLSDADKDEEDNEGVKQYLEELGYQQIDDVVVMLTQLRASPQIRHLTGDTIRLMVQLIESLIDKIADYPQQSVLVDRVGRILKALAGRKVYISLLNEFPAIQLQMLTLCAASEWFTERLIKYPILLDSLLSTAEAFRRKYDIRHLLELELGRIDADGGEQDLEQLMERMRQFKRQTVFTVAMLDVFYQEPVETVSDHLTELANELLEKILQFSWQAMVAKYGEPSCIVDGEVMYPQMSIIAYGKMGGNELGYGSDLDIIFIHNSQGEKQYTTGEKCIDNQQFFARVAQRVIHFLNTRTYSGILYEADTRLRPDGQSGMMVSSIAAFERYQQEKAWTWEHQALIRARFVTGSALIEQEFGRIRHSVLRRSRDRKQLLQEVVEMREKCASIWVINPLNLILSRMPVVWSISSL